MRALLFIGLLGLNTSAMCQAATDRSSWAIGVHGSMDRCFRALLNGTGDDARARIIRYRNERESWRIGWSFGVDATYALDATSERWLLTTGIQFTDRGYLFEGETDLISTDGVDPTIPSDHLHMDYRYHFRYLSVPAMLHFSSGKGRLRVEPGLGAWVDFLLSQYGILRNDFNGTVQTSRIADNITEFRKVSATACVELGTRLRLSEQWSIRFGPHGRIQMTALADAPIKGYLWEVGFFAGVHYHIP